MNDAQRQNTPKVVAGQRELEAIYSASRKADLGADQHERLRGLAQSVLVILEKASANGEVPTVSEKETEERVNRTPDPADDG